MPSTPTEYEIPNDGIHGWDSTNWNGSADVGVELQRHQDREDQRGEREDEGDLLREQASALREQRHHDAADERHHHEGGQPGKGSHEALTRTRARTTKTAPPTIDNAYERANPVW